MQMQMLASLGSGDGGSAFGNSSRGVSNDELLTAPPISSSARAIISGVVATPAITNADRVVAGMRPRARQCYATGLGSDPKIGGRVAVTLLVDAAGAVTTAQAIPAKDANISPAMKACLERFLGLATFDAPTKAPAKVSATILFEREK